MISTLEEIKEIVTPLLPSLFAGVPELNFGILPFSGVSSPDSPAGHYNSLSRAGSFFVNVRNTASRSKWETLALFLHEAVPGHHLQHSYARKNSEIPEFRKSFECSVFTEGWAHYAEGLGEEMGLFEKSSPLRWTSRSENLQVCSVGFRHGNSRFRLVEGKISSILSR